MISTEQIEKEKDGSTCEEIYNISRGQRECRAFWPQFCSIVFEEKAAFGLDGTEVLARRFRGGADIPEKGKTSAPQKL